MTEDDELKTFEEDYYFKKKNFQRKYTKQSQISWNRLAVQLMSNKILRRQRQREIGVEHAQAQKNAPL
jgi:hypothetical protein